MMQANAMARPIIYHDLQLDCFTGWGIFGLNFTKYAILQGYRVIVLSRNLPELKHFPFMDAALFKHVFEHSKPYHDKITRKEIIKDPNGIFVTHMSWGEEMRQNHPFLEVGRQIGVVFYEEIRHARKYAPKLTDTYDYVICGSRWNARHLIENGYARAVTIWQGVDSNYFYPRLAPLVDDGLFNIFSGGKLDLRKSQDIVLEAFAKIQDKIPHVRLISQWRWWEECKVAKLMNEARFMKYPWIIEQDENQTEKVNYRETARQYGIKPDRFMMLGTMPYWISPGHLNQCHMAIFPNRAEGGTNLVAMEAIGSGLPTILSNNTGQKDLFEICPLAHELGLKQSRTIIELDEQGQVDPTSRMAEWGWPDTDELADNILRTYHHYQKHRENAHKMAHQIADYRWEVQVSKMLDLIIHDKFPADINP
ncbi:MAG: glycosyltransferase family 4 protein [Alphaproteobacteria bacterium]